MSEVEKIISSARDKYTVHNCGECVYRKCCSCGFGSADCMSRRESIFLKLGIEDGYFSKLLDDIEAAWKRERAEAVGNAAAMHAALIEMRDHADKKIGVTCNVNLLAEYGWFVQKINAAIAEPPRNCDVGTAEEQENRFHTFCARWNGGVCIGCKVPVVMCECSLSWAQTPYAAEEGGKQ